MRRSDATSAGKSEEVPYIEGESASDRHQRRLDAAQAALAEVAPWCEEHGVCLTVSNDGHHWRFNIGGGVAEWWPSSAKLVFDKKWDDGVHVHGTKQLLRLLGERR